MTKAPLRILLLGGTGDALQLAQALADIPGIITISSLAGRINNPKLPTTGVRIGGFGGADGLIAYLLSQAIDAVIDATHPFAARMHHHAARACRDLALPLLALVAPAWLPTDGDHWHETNDMPAAAALGRTLGRRIFLTVGRQDLAPFASCDDQWFLIRAIDMPAGLLPHHHTLILQRGPFEVSNEREIMREHDIDLVVSKNSGGRATYAKISAARELGLPVVLVKRPSRPTVPTVETITEALTWIHALAHQEEIGAAR